MSVIGVLGLQGAVDEHIHEIHAVGAEGLIVKKPEQLELVDGLIIPGGESTTMRRLMDLYGFIEPIRNFSNQKKPIFGTCAGMVLLAKELIGDEEPYLKLMDISVKRNAFGRQVDSFEAALDVKGLEEPFSAVFIRAPYVSQVGENVEVLATLDGNVVAAKQDHLLVSSFHPELTSDTRFLNLFIEMVKESKMVLR